MKRVSQATSALSAAKACSAVGSRSMAISVPVGPSRSATRRAWPAPPSVQSIAVWPGRGSSASISSPARTGTWVWGMSRSVAKRFSQFRRSLGEAGVVVRPGRAVPDFQAVSDAGDDDLPADPGVLEETRRQHHAAGRVQLGLEGRPVQQPPRLAGLLRERIAELREGLVRHRRIRLCRIEADDVLD